VFSARYANPAGDGADEAAAYFKRNRKTADATDLIAPIRTVQIGELTVAREDSRLKGQAHFMAALALVTHGHLLSFQAHAATQERLKAVVKSPIRICAIQQHPEMTVETSPFHSGTW
jgi:hypothetical protein